MPAYKLPGSDWSRGRQAGPQLALPILLLLAVVSCLIFQHTLPDALVMPALSVLLLCEAGIFGALAWSGRGEARPGRISYWDIGGALTLLGICAALIGDSEQALSLLEARSGTAGLR